MADDEFVQRTSDPGSQASEAGAGEPEAPLPAARAVTPPAAPSMVHRHPVAVAIGAAVVGLLVGALLADVFARFLTPAPSPWDGPPPPMIWSNQPAPGWGAPPPPAPPPPHQHPAPPPWACGPPPPPGGPPGPPRPGPWGPPPPPAPPPPGQWGPPPPP